MSERSDRHHGGVWAPLLLTAALVVLESLSGPGGQYIGVLAAVPLLAAALTGPLATAFVGSVAALAGFLVGFTQDVAVGEGSLGMTSEQLVRVGFILGATALAVGVSATRTRREVQLRRVSGIADAAQRAILRPIPPAVGPLQCASVYLSATTEASIGGDLVEVLDTPFGVRAIVGDVRGKGMDAVRLAGQVLGSFREVAWTVPELSDVTVPLDRSVRRDAGPEDFVTAVLVQMTWDGAVTACTCGHPAPFVVGPCGEPAREMPVEPAPPLGMLGATPTATTVRLEAGQRLVLVTDGLLEARRGRGVLDRGPRDFLPVPELLGRHLATGSLHAGLAGLVTEVRSWTRGRLGDDMAVLVLQVQPAPARRGRRRQ